MYFNINNKTVKVSINNGKQFPSFLEQDLDTIAKHFNVSSINRISIVSDNDDYMGLTQGNIIKNKKCVDMFLTSKLLSMHDTANELYLTYLAHEVGHAKNFEMFSDVLNYSEYLKVKQHIVTTNDLYFSFGLTYLDEYLAFCTGNKFSPALVNLLGKDLDGNNIYNYSDKVLKMVEDISKWQYPAYNIFDTHQKSFELFIYTILQTMAYKNSKVKEYANEIIGRLSKNPLLLKYINNIQLWIDDNMAEYPQNLSKEMIVECGEVLFSIFKIANIKICDINGKFDFTTL